MKLKLWIVFCIIIAFALTIWTFADPKVQYVEPLIADALLGHALVLIILQGTSF